MTPKHSTLSTRHCNLRTLLMGLLLLTGVSAVGTAQAALPVPNLKSDTDIATAGFYRLSWRTGKITQVEAQEADNPAFRDASLHYQGPDDASVISGKANGTWDYRARLLRDRQSGPRSDVVKVTVAHHPLSRAFLFFGLGVAVFVATLLMVVRGAEGEGRAQ